MNITTASFGTDRTSTETSARTAPLWQYDYGQVLKIDGVELPTAYEVHFSNEKHGTSVTQIGNGDGVDIPDALLLSGKPVYAWVYLHTGLNDGETEYIITIPVNKRAQPTNATPTPVQQDAITQAIAALQEAVEHCDTITERYPKIVDGYWYIWDPDAGDFVNTGVDARGLKGDTGAVYVPDVSQNAVISWTNNGGLPNPDPVDITQAVHLDEYATKLEVQQKMDANLKGANNGVAELDAEGKVPSFQLPSYVDDVLEYSSINAFPRIGETGKIYVSTSNNTTYRWSGSQYVPIGSSLALGETSSTAYRGDRGKIAYDHAQAKGGAFALGLHKIQTNGEGHVVAIQTPTASDIPGMNNKADKADTVLDTTLSRGRAASASYPIGVGSFAFGNNVAATGDYSHAEGLNALALSNYSHAEGGGQVHANAAYAHAEGRGAEANAEGAHAEGGWADARGQYSHAEGSYTDAVGNYSHAEGSTTYAAGSASHAEGGNTVVAENATYGHAEGFSTHVENGGLYGHAEGYSNHVNAQAGHAEGYANSVTGNYGHAEGYGTTASGASGHSEGQGTTASGVNSHAEGCSTTASGTQAHTEGYYTSASGNQAHTEGYYTIAAGDNSHAEGRLTNAYGNNAHAEGHLTQAVGVASHAEGYNGTSGKSAVGLADHVEGFETGTYSDDNDTELNKVARHTEGYRTYATKQAAHAEGISTQAVAAGAHSEGGSTNASGDYAHAEGQGTNATGQYSHAEGGGTQATAMGAHAEGSGTRATEASAHSEGAGTYATGQCSHAEGAGTQATANYAHSEGSGSQANGGISHAEGAGSHAEGDVSHAEGASTNAYGSCSHSEGQCTTANGDCSHVSGAYNVADSYTNWPAWVANTHYDEGDKVKVTSSGVTTGYICNTENTDAEFTAAHWINRGGMMNYAEIVGNGSSSGYSNARALDWDGNEYLAGDLYVGCNSSSSGGVKVATTNDIPAVATTTETAAIISEYGVSA